MAPTKSAAAAPKTRAAIFHCREPSAEPPAMSTAAA